MNLENSDIKIGTRLFARTDSPLFTISDYEVKNIVGDVVFIQETRSYNIISSIIFSSDILKKFFTVDYIPD